MYKLNLEGLNTTEIRELIIDQKIDINTMPLETIRELFEYEVEKIDNCDEPTIIDELLEILNHTDQFDYAYSFVSEERCAELAQEAIEKTSAQKHIRRMPRLKKIILIAAAVIVLSSLGLTVYASYLGPFEGFVDNIKDLFGIEVGEIITNGDSQLTVDSNPRYYTDFETLIIDCEYDILFPRGIKPSGEHPVRMYYSGKSLHIFAQYNNVMFEVYLTNIPFTEEDLTRQAPNAEKFIVNGHTYYYVSNSPNQYNLFYNNQLYIIHATAYDDFLLFAQQINK